MKKVFLMVAALALSTAMNAAILTVNCTQFVGNGPSGTGQDICPAVTGLPNDAVISSITLTTVFDFQFNPTVSPGATATVTYTFDLPAAVGSDVSATITNAGRPNVVNVAVTSAALAGFTVDDSWTGTANVTGATFDKFLTVDYSTGVPEPSSLALLGSALIGLGIAARRRK